MEKNKPFEHYSESDWNKRMTLAITHSGFTWTKHLRCLATLIYNDLGCLLTQSANFFVGRLRPAYRLKWDWWNRLDLKEGNHSDQEPHIYLGAFPIKKRLGKFHLRHDCHYLASQLNVKAVLSLVEPYEMNVSTGLMNPVQSSDWKKQGICFLQLPTPDFTPLKKETIDEAAAFIHWNVKMNRNIYVHCKAGRGRSALVLTCYLMKYRSMTLEQAGRFIKKTRPQVNLNFIKHCISRFYE